MGIWKQIERTVKKARGKDVPALEIEIDPEFAEFIQKGEAFLKAALKSYFAEGRELTIEKLEKMFSGLQTDVIEFGNMSAHELAENVLQIVKEAVLEAID